MEAHPTYYCTDQDFSTSLKISQFLLKHSLSVYQVLPAKEKSGNQAIISFQDSLPYGEFTRNTANLIGEQLSLQKRTVGKYLKYLSDSDSIKSIKHGVYLKV